MEEVGRLSQLQDAEYTPKAMDAPFSLVNRDRSVSAERAKELKPAEAEALPAEAEVGAASANEGAIELMELA